MENRAEWKKQSFTDVFPPAGADNRASHPAASTVTLTSVDSQARANNNRTPLATNNNMRNITNTNVEIPPPPTASTINSSNKNEEKQPHQSYRETAKLRTRKSFSGFSSGLKQGVHEIAAAAKRLSINRMRHKYSKKDLHNHSPSQTHSSSINLAAQGQSSSSSPHGNLRPHSHIQIRPHSRSPEVFDDGTQECAIPPVPPLPAPFHQRSHTQGNAIASPQSLPPLTTTTPTTTSPVAPSPSNNNLATNANEIVISPRPMTSAADSQYSNHAQAQDSANADAATATGAAALAEPSSERADGDGQVGGNDAPLKSCRPSLTDSKIFVTSAVGDVKDKERDRVLRRLNEDDRESKPEEVGFKVNIGETEPSNETDTESGIDVTECNDAEEDEVSDGVVKKGEQSPPNIFPLNIANSAC